MATAARPILGLMGAGVLGYFAYAASQPQPALVRAQSDAGTQKKKAALMRRHSSGDHAFLPNRQERTAIKEANKSFGVPKNLVQDAVGDRLPTTRGY